LVTRISAEAITSSAVTVSTSRCAKSRLTAWANKPEFAHRLELTATSVLVEIHSDIGGIIERVLRAMPSTDPSPKVEPKL